MLAGVAAVVALTALTIGVPIALITVIGLPLPHTMPGVSALTGQLDIGAILRILSVVIWLAWIQLVWCVLVEIKAAVSNVGVPSRVPLAGPAQSAAHRLVMTALLLFTAAAALAPAVHSSAPPRPVPSISAQVTPGIPAGAELTTQGGPATPAHTAPNAEKAYLVKPPVGRFHESLWEIAHNHLGDGRRYREIFELNKDHVQPDGSKLTIASLIRPGWMLLMPKDAHGPGIEAVTPKLASDLGLASHASAGRWGGGRHGLDLHPPTGYLADSCQGGPFGRTEFSPRRDQPPIRPQPGLMSCRRPRCWPPGCWSRWVGGGGSSCGGGRSGAGSPARIRTRRWPRRRCGSARTTRRCGCSTPAYATCPGSSPLPAGRRPPCSRPTWAGRTWICGSPRPIRTRRRLGRPPTAARCGGCRSRPPPGSTRWPRRTCRPGRPGRALAPYPGLVSLGTNAAGRILVDLEVAHGLIAVRGPRQVVQAALSALAVELVTNRWSDRMQVTLVGFGDGLSELAPERVRVIRTLDEALPELEKHAAQVRSAMAAAGLDSVLTGRSRTADADAWAPHYLIMGVPPTQAQAERLLALARSRYRMAAGYVIAGDVRGATWTWDLSEDGRLQAGVLGFDLEAQLLPPEQYAAMVKLFRGTAAGADVPLAALAPGAAPAAQLVPGTRMPVEVGLLGLLAVQAPGPLEPDRLALATELVVYLATHPDGVHTNVLTGAVWPRGVSHEVRDAALSRVHAWLGTDETGQPNLLTDSVRPAAPGPRRPGRLAGVPRPVRAGQPGRRGVRCRAPRRTAWNGRWPWSAASSWTGAIRPGTRGWPPTTWSTRSPRRSPTPRTGWPRCGWRRGNRTRRWTRRGPGSGSPSTTSCSGATC